MELSILWWIQQNLRCPFTDWLFPVITFLGNNALIWILIAACLLISKRDRHWGIMMLAAFIITTLAGELLLKNLVMRPRPCTFYPEMELLIPRPTSYSFPSGHSSSSFAAAVVLFHFKKKFGIPAFILAALISFSRLFLFVHYPSDVLAGAALGILFGLLVCWLWKKWWPQPSQTSASK